MHAVFITFRSAVSPVEREDDYRQFAEALRDGAAPGFISKTWLCEGQMVGGFYQFQDRQAADSFLEGMFAAAVPTDPAVSDIRIERYDINEAMSEITNGLHAMPAGGRV